MRNKMMYRHMLDPGLSKALVIDSREGVATCYPNP